MNDNNPVPVVSSPTPIPASKKGIRKTLLVILVALVVLGFMLPFVVILVGGSVAARSLPAGTHFLAESKKGTVTYTAQAFWFSMHVSDATLVSADERSPNSARIVRSSDGMYTLLLGTTTIISTSTPLFGVSVSPDGNTVAYAHGLIASPPFQAPHQIPTTTYDSNTSKVAIHSINGGTTVDIGPGSAPLFFDATHVLYFAPAGAYMADLKTGSSTLLLAQHFNQAPVAVLQSPDRTHVAWRSNTAPRKATVYRVTASNIQKIAELPYDNVSSSALGNDAIYFVRHSPLMTQVTRQAFDEKAPRQVTMLPSLFNVTRIVIGAL